MSLPASELSQEPKEVFHLSTGIIFKLLVVSVQFFRYLDSVIFDFVFNHGMNVKLNALTVLVSLVKGNLKLNFTEFCDNVMEAITQHRCVFGVHRLADWNVKLLKELLLTFN